MKKLIKEEGLKPDQIVNGGAGYLIGGGTDLSWCQVIAVPAIHTSNSSIAMGTILIAQDGTTIYHTGDTSLTGEMEIYARLYPIDILILPIFGQASMDPLQAAEATKLIKPKKSNADSFLFLCRSRGSIAKIYQILQRKKSRC